MHPSSSLGTVPSKATPKIHFRQVEQIAIDSRKTNILRFEREKVTKLVAHQNQPKEWDILGTRSPSSNNNRCQPPCLGSGRPGKLLSGNMEELRETAILKFQRAKASLGSTETHESVVSRSSRPNLLGQRYSCGLHPTPGRHKASSTTEPGKQNVLLGRRERTVSVSGTCEGIFKHSGRLPESAHVRPRRMDVSPGNLPSNHEEMGQTDGRTVCIQEKSSVKSVLLPQPQGSSSGSRRLQPELDNKFSLRISSVSTHPQSAAEVLERELYPNPDNALLAQERLVFSIKSPQHRSPSPSTSEAGPSKSGTHYSPRPENTNVKSLDSVESNLLKQGLSKKVVNTLLLSRKQSTNDKYLKIWGQFADWSGTSFNQFRANIPLILEFLQEGLDLGLSPNTLRVQVSALGALYNTKLTVHPWISRFLKAADRIRPTIKNMVAPWNLNTVLGGLTSDPFEPMDSTHIKWLTVKTIFLVAITSARRVCELQALSIQEPFFSVFQDKLVLKLDPAFLPKVVLNFHRSQDIVLPSFCDNPKNDQEITYHTLDVRRVVLKYLEATKHWRVDKNLFVQFPGPNKGKKAAKSSISRWIRLAISEAYKVQGKDFPKSTFHKRHGCLLGGKSFSLFTTDL
ncbi:uncharacterized protein LOC122944410 [Bufo gargarizans]|uniref:uncharacterized protein LOC122944410 n=1 Tax=Bufo gargarizans TaxID=30331 RepID=UPI001CF32F15|nr:uncharacterized protein LOC122944410 [Bufo gargarizans]